MLLSCLTPVSHFFKGAVIILELTENCLTDLITLLALSFHTYFDQIAGTLVQMHDGWAFLSKAE